jgi:hypothetical protein
LKSNASAVLSLSIRPIVDRQGHRVDDSRFHVVLWIVQGLLAVIFLFAGGVKLVLPLVSVDP